MGLDKALLSRLGVVGSGPSEVHGEENEEPQDVNVFVRLKQNLFMLLYLLAKDSKTSLVSLYVQEFIGTCQLVYFAVSLPGYKWHSFMHENIVPFLRITNLQFMKNINGDFHFALFGASMALVILTFLLCTWIMTMFGASGMARYMWVLPFLRLLTRMLMGVLYLPVLTSLSAGLSCDSVSPVDNFAPCGTSARLWVAIGISIVLVFFISFNCLVSFTIVDNDPSSRSALARVHGRVDAVHLLVRAILSLTFTFTLTSASTIPTIVVVVACGAIGTGAYFLNLPYLNPHVNRLKVSSSAVFLWSGVGLIVAEVIGRRDDFGAAMSFILGIPLVICSSVWLVGNRELKLARMEPHSGSSPFEVEMILRFKLAPTHENWQDIQKQYRHVVEISFGNDPLLMVTLATLAERIGKNEVLSGQLMRKVSMMNSKSLDQSFLVFQYFQKRRERSTGSAEGALSYVALTHHRKTVETEIKTLLELGYKLWSMLGKSESSNSSDFFHIATQIHSHTSLAKDHLNKLVQISNGSKQTLQLYAIYAEYVMNDKSLAKKLIRAAEAAAGSNDSFSIVAVTISGEQGSLGEILDCTDETPAVFGTTKDQMIGRNVSMLCPEPFDVLHNKFLEAYLQNNTDFVTVTRDIWARHVSGGYAMSMKLTVTPQQDATGALTFVGAFEPNQNPRDFVCVDKNGMIKFFSSGMASELGIRSVGGETSIFSFIPELENVVNLKEPSNESRIELDLDGTRYEISMEPCQFRKHSSVADQGLVILSFLKTFVHDDTVVAESEFGDEAADVQEENTHKTSPIKRALTIRPPPLASNSLTFGPSKGEVGNDYDDDEIQSKQSHESGSSSVVSKTTATIHALQSVVQARVANDERRLRRFWILIRNLVILFWVFSIGALVGLRTFWDQFHGVTGLLILSTERAYAVIEATLAMEHHFNVIIPNDSDEAQDIWEIVPNTILTACSTVREKHELLVQDSLTQADSKQMGYLHDPQGVNITYDGVSYDKISFHAAMLKFAVAGEAFQKDAVTECTDNCKYIMNNGPWDLVEAAFHSSRLYADELFTVLSELKKFSWAIVVAAYAISLAVLVWRIFPVVNDIRRTRDVLLDALEKVPPNQIQMLKRKYRTKLRRAKVRIAGLNGKVSADAMEGVDDDNDEDATKQAPPRQGSVGEKVQVAITAGKDRSMKMFRKKVVPENNTTYKRFRRPRSNHIINIFKLSIPLLLLPAYFVIGALINDQITNNLGSQVGTIYWTGLLWVTGQRAHISVEAPDPLPPWIRWYTDPEKYNATQDIFNFYQQMIVQSRNINYGNLDADVPVVPMLDKDLYPNQYRLQFENACLTDACKELLEIGEDVVIKDMSFGLNIAMDNFIHRLGLLLHEPSIEAIPFLATFHLAVAIKQSLIYYSEGLRRNTDQQMESQLFMSIGFMGVTVLFCAVVYRTFKKTINELKQAQYTLLMLPPELIRDVPELKELSNDKSSS